MKIYSCIEDFYSFSPCVFSLGFFDGVHLGHKKLINYLLKQTKKEKYTSVLLTFNPHPKEVLNPKQKIFYLNTLSEKICHLKQTGIEHLIIHPFTTKFSQMNIQNFLKNKLLSSIKIEIFIIGYDFHVGKNRIHAYNNLQYCSKLYGFTLKQINPYKIQNTIICSTNIRQSILNGDIKWSNQALGYSYSLSGYVIKGNGIGRKILTYPTANIQITNNKILPKKGVYAVNVLFLETIYQGIMNIGTSPTININNKKIKIEVHIFNFCKILYGKIINLFIIEMIREEKKFNSIQELKTQIKLDQITAKSVLKFQSS
ncbi:bifunctional riboflavin kinase/FAD synthetase [Blattabacterium cuenoti]|uniref:bifunctional riboflavin kinase/FAD synthetase n=1 Tax=Blattabacterium cuenoti TaxID=1653831 RepID=UPI00163B8AFE|nr:bifunctional riboflavin kinase/FAD synthetase [Blattabacterium cuenoti]